MYIPMYKKRLYENNFLKDYGYYFKQDKIMPYIEFINYKIGRKDCSLKEHYDYYDLFINSSYFVDFFAYADGEYKQLNIDLVGLSNDTRIEGYLDYLDRLKTTINSKKAIPVVSIKKGRQGVTKKEEFEFIIKELQKEKEVIAVRLEAVLFSNYYDIIKKLLRPADYFFFDIREENLDPFVLDLFEITEDDNFIKILANSPRHRDITNSNYLEAGYTDLIDNFAKDKYRQNNFNGYSDYSGLKDDMPKSGGSGLGAAIAVLYDSEINKYFTITNKNTSEGVRGYKKIVEKIKTDEIKKLLHLNDCLAYDYLEKNLFSRNTSGNFAMWNFITILRTFSEAIKFL